MTAKDLLNQGVDLARRRDYAGAIALYFWRTIVTTPYRLLLLASGLLIISAAADFLPISGIGTPIMLEDGTKLLGLVNLTLYIWRSAQQALTNQSLQS